MKHTALELDEEPTQDRLTHIDLFSGIGGFALACQWVGIKTVVFCEKDSFCQKILKKHWPEVSIIPNVRDFDGTKWTGATILTGGFPCQPFSVAGKRRGKEDDRYLWPEMFRIISEARPTWIVGENVAGIIRMGIEQMLSDLEGIQYKVQLFIIPACAQNAPHQRNRIWIIANSKGNDGYNLGLQNYGNTPHGEEFRRCFRDESCPPLCRVDDGISSELDRLRALGNAIVPQVAYQIIKAIVEIEHGPPQL